MKLPRLISIFNSTINSLALPELFGFGRRPCSDTMDPLSMTTAVCTLIGAVATLGKAVRSIARLKDADVEIATATKTLEIIQSIVDELEIAETSSGIHQIVSASRFLIAAIEEAFPRPSNSSRCRQLRWVFKDQKAVAKLQSELNNVGSLLSIYLLLNDM